MPSPWSACALFWDTEACGTHFVTHYSNDRDFFSKYREFRYRTEWHIPEFAEFAEAAGKRVLEIGCGNGTDGVMFALNGADYTGVDLTAEAVEATRRHFAVEGLRAVFRQENSERLSFANNSFDIVYSFGVLHHTPIPEQAVAEVYRVLKPGGTARIMLYHRHSFNYYVRILGYMRTRMLLKVASRFRQWEADRRRAATHVELAGRAWQRVARRVGDPLSEFPEGWVALLQRSHLRAPLHRRARMPVRIPYYRAKCGTPVRAVSGRFTSRSGTSH